MKKIYIATSSFNRELVSNLNYNVDFNDLGRTLTEEEMLELIDSDVEGIVAGTEPYNSRTIAHFKNLKCVSRCGSGMDNIDVKIMKEYGVSIKNTPKAPVRAVAELTLGLILSLLRDISVNNQNIRSNNWKKQNGNLLYKKNVGIIGYGLIGKQVDKYLTAFGANVTFYDNDISLNNHIKYRNLSTLLSESDILTIHLPSNDITREIFSRSFFQQLKRGTLLINTSRGDLLSEDFLLEFTENGTIKKMGLDVLPNEPYGGELLKNDESVFTPHIGSYTFESRYLQEEESILNLIEVLDEN
jgi:D-3-phosphoglycerate dehydrogenase